MTGRRRSPSWVFAVVASFLLRPVVGFLGSAGTTWAARRTAPARIRIRSSNSGGCSKPSDARQTARPGGAGGLRAALEVEPVRDLEIGSVLVAGADNYGHMTFKVGQLALTLFFPLLLRHPRVMCGLRYSSSACLRAADGDVRPSKGALCCGLSTALSSASTSVELTWTLAFDVDMLQPW